MLIICTARADIDSSITPSADDCPFFPRLKGVIFATLLVHARQEFDYTNKNNEMW
jgi:hypothetical protein